jgi:predicted dehydrogenase
VASGGHKSDVDAPLGIGIIASGLQAETYAACLAGHVTDARFTAIWGGSRADELAARYGARAVGSAQDLVDADDVDVVFITSPNTSHLEYGLQALDAGRHVAVERPIAVTARDAQRLANEATDRNLLFTTLQTGRYMHGPQAARAAIDAGRIGQPRMAQLVWTGTSYPIDPANWRARPAEGGVFLDVGEHAFDLVRWLMGADIERVHARVANFGGIEYPEPSAMVQLEFANGALGQAWISFEVPWPGLPRSACRVLVVGETGILDVDSYGESWLRRAAKLGRAPKEYLDTTDFGHADLGTGVEWVRLAEEQPGDSSVVARDDIRRIGKFVVQVQEIVDAVRGRRPWPTQGRDGVLAIATVEAARRSAASGQPERVDPAA